MLTIPDLTRQLRVWLAQQRCPRRPGWIVHETVVGITAAGDAIAALVVEPTSALHDPSLLLETWSKASCVEVREIRPECAGDGRYVLFAVYTGLRLEHIDHWKLGTPGGALTTARPPRPETGARTRFKRVLDRIILVPGDPRRLALRGVQTLHHDDCYTLRWVTESSLERAPDVQAMLTIPVRVCRACVPPPPL